MIKSLGLARLLLGIADANLLAHRPPFSNHRLPANEG